jgi:Aspartyl protease
VDFEQCHNIARPGQRAPAAERSLERTAKMGIKGALAALIMALAPLSVGAVSTSGSDPQALDLLAKHKAFVGWQLGDGTFTTMRIAGNVSDEKGKQIATLSLLWSGLLSNDAYIDLKRNGVTERTGFTGNLFWETDYNGFTTPVYGDYAKFLASATLLKNEGTTELPSTYRGSETVDGKSVGVVRVTLKNGDPIDLYVYPATGAYVKATIDPDGAYETTYHIRSYQDILPGKKMVSSYTVDDDKVVTTYTKFEPNITVEDAELHPSSAISSWTFGDGAPFPFTMTHDRMLVDATVNGVKGRFLLDTGDDSITLDDQFANRAQAQVLNNSDTGYSVYGEIKTRLRKISTITFGNNTLHDVVAFSQHFDMSDYGFDEDHDHFDGLIGFDLFAGAIIKLNVYASTMTILDPNTDLSAEKGLPVLVDLSQGVPIVPMTLNRAIPVNAMLDTGNPGLILFGRDLISKYHFKTFDGCAPIQSLSIGPIVYGNQSACEYGVGANYMLIGFDFLKHFDFVFDYPHGRMFMTPNRN